MATGNDLLERENQAANEADNLNPGQKHSDQTFSRGQHDDIEGYDRDNDGLDAYDDVDFNERKPVQYTDTHGDTVNSNYNADDSTDDNIRSVNDQEKNPSGGWTTTIGKQAASGAPGSGLGSAKITIKGKKGPTTSMVGLLLGGGTVITVTLSPGLLLTQMKEIFHNDRADATRTSLVMTRAMLAVAFKANHISDPCTGKSKISCRLGSVSKGLIEKYKKAGFKIDAVEVDKDGKETGKNAGDPVDPNAPPDSSSDQNRYKVNSMTFPDGHKSTTGADFDRHTDSSLGARRVAMNGYDARPAQYLKKKFTDTLVKHLGVKNGKQPTEYPEGDTAEDRQARDARFNEVTGGSSEADAESNARRVSQEIESDARENAGRDAGKNGKTGGITGFVQAVCAGYKGINAGLASVKVAHMTRLANFAMEFLKVADMIKMGTATATAVSYLSDRLTYVERNEYLENGEKNPKYNLSATDSQGYRIAAHGDASGLAGFAQKYVLGYSGEGEVSMSTKVLLGATVGIGTFQAIAGAVVNAVKPGQDVNGKDVMKNVCRTANSAAVIAAQCAVLAGSAIFSGTVSGPFAAFTTAMALKMCQCSFGVGQFSDKLIGDAGGLNPVSCEDLQDAIGTLKAALIAATAGAVAKAAESVIRNWNIGSDTKGVDAGNAMAAGAGLILATAATSYALKPTTKSAHKSYISYTDSYMDKIAEIDKDDAKKNPLDMSNKYSFLGSLSRSVAVGDVGKTPIYSGITNLLGVVPAGLSSIVKPAGALYTSPVQEQIQRYDCNNDKEIKDEGLAYLEVDGDKNCNIITDTPVEELKKIDEQATKTESQYFQETREWMEKEQNRSEEDGGTADNGDGCEKGCDGEPSIDGDGKPLENSQYQKWLTYCTDQREDPWGMSSHPFEEGSERDQDWFTGKQCLKNSEMLVKFRTWNKICNDTAARQGTLDCSQDAATQTAADAGSSECAGGGRKAIYTCALKYDNYRYLWGGGHGGNAQEWIKKFNAGEIPEWTQILDCSGLVRMAYVEAMGKEAPGHTSGALMSAPEWQQIKPEDAEQGDIITNENHVAIIKSNDKANKKFETFDAETESGAKEANIQHMSYDYGFGTVMRAKE